MFQESLADKDLLDTRNDLALMDTALAPLLQRAEEADCPAWRARVRDAFTELEAAVKKKQHARVGPLMRALGTLIEEGAKADEIAGDLMRHVDRRAARAHRINELEVRREATVSPGELVAIFGSWIEVLRAELDDKVFRALLPKLQALATGPRAGVVGAAAEREGERARGRGMRREIRLDRVWTNGLVGDPPGSESKRSGVASRFGGKLLLMPHGVFPRRKGLTTSNEYPEGR